MYNKVVGVAVNVDATMLIPRKPETQNPKTEVNGKQNKKRLITSRWRRPNNNAAAALLNLMHPRTYAIEAIRNHF
jgi:hypothetical protein